jgi:hypothetical protein
MASKCFWRGGWSCWSGYAARKEFSKSCLCRPLAVVESRRCSCWPCLTVNYDRKCLEEPL